MRALAQVLCLPNKCFIAGLFEGRFFSVAVVDIAVGDKDLGEVAVSPAWSAADTGFIDIDRRLKHSTRMLSSSDWNHILTEVASELSLSVFDFELPQRRQSGDGGGKGPRKGRKAQGKKVASSGGTFKIFLWGNREQKRGASLEECGAFARALRRREEFRALEEEQVHLEVSSPGVNRKLRSQEHFEQALGERVYIKSSNPAVNGSAVCRGVVEFVDGEIIRLRNEETNDLVDLSLLEIRQAHVDFSF